jgi:hypothetical protein
MAVFATAGCRVYLDDPNGEAQTDAGISVTCMEATQHSDLAWIQENIFSASCVFSGCHKGTASSAGFLSLEVGKSFVQLVDKPVTKPTGFTRVVAGDRSMSYLMSAINAGGPTTEVPKDGYMPQGNPQLCQEKKDAIGRWIDAGALNN